MDGNRDRPPGKTAENWSRRDNIRAGAVSGPWRSAPRAAGAPTVAVEEIPLEELEATAPVWRRRTSGAAWVALGCGVAAAFLAAAWLLRPAADPAPVDETPASVMQEAASAEPPAEPAPVAEAMPAAPDPALRGISSVRLRIPDEMPEARRAAIVVALQAGGLEDVRVEALPFAVETSRVGYYLAADADAADALARLAGAALDLSLPVRDYGKLLDDPTPGQIELWVGR